MGPWGLSRSTPKLKSITRKVRSFVFFSNQENKDNHQEHAMKTNTPRKLQIPNIGLWIHGWLIYQTTHSLMAESTPFSRFPTISYNGDQVDHVDHVDQVDNSRSWCTLSCRVYLRSLHPFFDDCYSLIHDIASIFKNNGPIWYLYLKLETTSSLINHGIVEFDEA